MDETVITTAVVSALVAEQFPQWAHLPVTPVELDGWDNTTFRLGDGLSARLPSADAYVAQVDKEHRWLPVLAPHLPLPIPEPVAKGAPGCGFPRPWSVYRWLAGRPAAGQRVADPVRLAVDLADFLRALYAVDPAGGPEPGPHNFFRGGPVTTYDVETRATLATLENAIDTGAATDVWEAALASPWCGSAVWIHGDVTAANLLLDDERLHAVIDFGCSAVGDPACDLTMAWTFFSGSSRRAFRDRLGLDDDTWARGRGWALWKALITVAKSDEAGLAARRFGWRPSARGVVDEVLADHARLSR